MPEMDSLLPMTPVYDVLVWLHEDMSSPITVAYKKLKKEANEICHNLAPPPSTMVNHYYYPTKEGGGHEAWLNKNYIVRCEVQQSTKQMWHSDPDGFSYSYYELVYLEDLENEND